MSRLELGQGDYIVQAALLWCRLFFGNMSQISRRIIACYVDDETASGEDSLTSWHADREEDVTPFLK